MTVDDAIAALRAEFVAAATRQADARGRRRRRLTLVAGAVILSAAMAAAAVAASTLLTGRPAPPAVVSDFGSYAPGLGFHPNPGDAVEVAHDGDVTLYATTNQEGAYCLIVSTPWKRPESLPDGGSCLRASQAADPLTAFTGGAANDAAANETTLAIDGRATAPNVKTVTLTLPAGTTITRPVGSDGFFVAKLSFQGSSCSLGKWTSTIHALDGRGNTLETATKTLWRGCLTPQTRSP